MKKKLLIILLIFIILVCIGLVYWFIIRSETSKPPILSETKAIEIIKNKFPELAEYPSDSLPPKSIKTEKDDDNWYIAFVQEGSGVQVIEAQCFFLKNENDIVQTKYSPKYSPPENTPVGEFSPKLCQIVEDVVGGDEDENGCLGSAGYSWCSSKQKCLRAWEERCDDNVENPSCVLETCHGLDIVCGPNSPEACTTIYATGDKCLQYVECGLQNGGCRQILNSQFTECKTCVQNCLDANQSDVVKLSECEGQCL